MFQNILAVHNEVAIVASLSVMAMAAKAGVMCANISTKTNHNNDSSKNANNRDAYRSFRLNYLFVFLCMTAADWLQGPYLYALYSEYGFTQTDISLLFIIGFGASGIAGVVVGSVADSFGRKKVALCFVIIYSVSCFTKHYANFYILAFGRVMGGIATSMLFSVFDAWMIHAHHEREFDAPLLEKTFSVAAFSNATVAIVSSVVASIAVYLWGKVAPFDIAVACMLCGGVVLMFTWEENFGDIAETGSIKESVHMAWLLCRDNPAIVYCGFLQAFFESAMYTFVLMWTPALPADVNHGLVFAAFMVAVMIGSSIFDLMRAWGLSLEKILQCVFMTASMSFMLTSLAPPSATSVFIVLFCVYESCVGIYYSAFNSLRAQIVPNAARATIFNFYRIPLNVLVVVTCLYASQMEQKTVFMICSAAQILGLVCLFGVQTSQKYSVTRKGEDLQEMGVLNASPAKPVAAV